MRKYKLLKNYPSIASLRRKTPPLNIRQSKIWTYNKLTTKR